jgi:hypothetical protein
MVPELFRGSFQKNGKSYAIFIPSESVMLAAFLTDLIDQGLTKYGYINESLDILKRSVQYNKKRIHIFHQANGALLMGSGFPPAAGNPRILN